MGFARVSGPNNIPRTSHGGVSMPKAAALCRRILTRRRPQAASRRFTMGRCLDAVRDSTLPAGCGEPASGNRGRGQVRLLKRPASKGISLQERRAFVYIDACLLRSSSVFFFLYSFSSISPCVHLLLFFSSLSFFVLFLICQSLVLGQSRSFLCIPRKLLLTTTAAAADEYFISIFIFFIHILHSA